MNDAPLTPEALAADWYRAAIPADWKIGFGDVFPRIPFLYRDADTGLVLSEPVLAISAAHPCDMREPLPRSLPFVRAYFLEDYLADNPRIWSDLPSIQREGHFDFALLPPWPGRWETEILADLADPFSVPPEDVDFDSRLASLNDDYWRTFGWYVARRAGRSGAACRVFPFKTSLIPPDPADPPLPVTIDPGRFQSPLGPGEITVHPRIGPSLTLTRLRREQARQDWWRAQWRGQDQLIGYGLSPEQAVENLVRAVRRAAARLQRGELPPEGAAKLRAALASCGAGT